MKTLILGAGEGFRLDNFNKLLLLNPNTGNTILQDYVNTFKSENLIVGVGYRAISVVHQYPKLNYVVNNNWSETKSVETLRLCLDEINDMNEEVLILPGDVFITQDTLHQMCNDKGNVIYCTKKENNKIKRRGIILELENDSIKNMHIDYSMTNSIEAFGAFKFSSAAVIRDTLSKGGSDIKSLFVSELLCKDFNSDKPTTQSFIAKNVTNSICEIEVVEDYIRYVKRQ